GRVCPLKVKISWPLAASQSFTWGGRGADVKSVPAEATRLPSGETAIPLIVMPGSSNLRTTLPLEISCNSIFLRRPAKTCLPSGENLTELSQSTIPHVRDANGSV